MPSLSIASLFGTKKVLTSVIKQTNNDIESEDVSEVSIQLEANLSINTS